ncbi:hypothetical protein [Polluticaenibacter yanchengensis]|uniref:Uncharacterized protein n=1 Tax=Polluticaenibacter yanchengensis TaxID=3014562 RepID=A0ABT4UFU1_9BACT|nr:hypothetical protein [Chitinophagaceae bacterium LY-5]
MAVKITNAYLQKVERLLNEAEYKIRFERGTFQSGYCILEQKKVVVVNKFLDVEGRINALVELVPKITLNYDMLTQESQKLYDKIIKEQNESVASQIDLDLKDENES